MHLVVDLNSQIFPLFSLHISRFSPPLEISVKQNGILQLLISKFSCQALPNINQFVCPVEYSKANFVHLNFLCKMKYFNFEL